MGVIMNYKAIAAAILAFAMALSCGDFKAKTTEDAQSATETEKSVANKKDFNISAEVLKILIIVS